MQCLAGNPRTSDVRTFDMRVSGLGTERWKERSDVSQITLQLA
jgi:hypothetical protein